MLSFLRLEIRLAGIAALLLATGLSAAATPAAERTRAVPTESGPIRGIRGAGSSQYLGIPYAAPPVGALRWQPPRSHTRWEGVRDANAHGNQCPQLNFFGTAFGDEDCLSLNVYAPHRTKRERRRQERLPVMVWIHGGSLTTGSGGDFDPTPLAEKGRVVVVTINYRLGALGFLAHPALDAEGHTNANYGLMDQQRALRWVRRNIAAFGGDPDRVTIFGESAGGLSVLSQLASPTAEGLFHRAISQSGAYASFQSYLQSIVPLVQAETGGLALAAAAGCADQSASCLRALPPVALLAVQPGLVDPIVDGELLTATPAAAFASGEFNRVPVITGTNHDEWRLFTALFYDYTGALLTDADYVAAVGALMGLPPSDPFVQLLLAIYPLSDFPPPPGVASAPLAYGAIGSDFFFVCPGRKAAIALSQWVPTYGYEFNDRNAPLSLGLVPASFPFGAYHAAEIQYLMNFVGVPAPFTPEQQALSDAMIGYWARFARTGNPNGEGLPEWSPNGAASDLFQSLAPPEPTPMAGFDADHTCSTFWDTF
jgi:para-nitrobenzyl esterase